jgi:lysine-N-methylase
LDFSFGEDDKKNAQQAEKEETYLYNALIAGRSLSVDLMQIKEIPFWMRLYLCLNIADKIQEAIDGGNSQKAKEEISSFQQAEYLTTIIQSLSGMNRNISFQIGQYNFLIHIISELDITNDTFRGLFLESAKFLEGQEEAGFEEKFERLWEKFDDCIKENRAFEHYAVYHLFHYYMNAYSDKQPYKYVAIMVETYALMRLYAMVRWMNQGFRLEQEDLIDIFYSCSRMIEHGRDVLSKLYNQMEEHEMNTKASLITLIR